LPEDAGARLALPEYQVIPAARPDELTPAAPLDAKAFTTWTRSHGDAGSRRYSALDQINRGNVAGLTVAWTYRSGDGARNLQATPIIADGVLYGPRAGRHIITLDAASGRKVGAPEGDAWVAFFTPAKE